MCLHNIRSCLEDGFPLIRLQSLLWLECWEVCIYTDLCLSHPENLHLHQIKTSSLTQKTRERKLPNKHSKMHPQPKTSLNVSGLNAAYSHELC